MAELMRRTNWSETPLGPMESWAPAMRNCISLVLASNFPMISFWGQHFCCIYNDAYIPILGAKHQGSLGQPVAAIFPEIWEDIQRNLELVVRTGEALWREDEHLRLTRNGYEEECYFTFSYTPVAIEDGSIGGILTPVTETTKRVLAERRMQTLRLLAARTSAVNSVTKVFQSATDVFCKQNADIAFAFSYFIDGGEVKLKGITEGFPAEKAPKSLILDATKLPSPTQIPDEESLAVSEQDDDSWSILKTILSGEMTQLHDLEATFGPLPGRASEKNRTPKTAVVMPLKASDDDEVIGVLVLGINPLRKLDDEYLGFIDLVSRQLATSVDSAKDYEDAKKRAEALAEIDRVKTTFFENST